MRFDSIIIENFMSVKHAEVSLTSLGLVLIQGKNETAGSFQSNGSGKSTIYTEAPCWCLFGETIRGQKADDVVNRFEGKNTHVGTVIVDDNGDTYEIHRYRKHKEHKNAVMLFHNGNNITQKSDTDTTKKIEDILQMDFLTFTNSILFGQGISKGFASTTDAEQKKILERMLQIDIFRACQDKAKIYLSDTEKLKSSLEVEVNLLKKKKSTLETTVTELQTKEAELETIVKGRVQSLNSEVITLNKQLSDIEPDTELIVKKEGIFTETEKIETELKTFSTYEKSNVDLGGELYSAQKDSKALLSSIVDLNKKIENIKAGINVPKTCTTCGQDLPLKDNTHLINHMLSQIEECEVARKECEIEAEEITGLLAKVNEKLKEKEPLEKSKQALQVKLVEINSSIRLKDEQRNNIKRMALNIEKQIAEQKKLLETTYTEIINSNIKTIKDVEQQITEATQEIDSYTESIEKYNFWVNAYGNQGIKSILLDSVTPFLNQRANYYSGKLSDSTLSIILNTQTKLKSGETRDKFSVEVINQNGDDGYVGLSGGEKKRIDISLNMALQDLMQSRSSKRFDMVVYDEVFEALDSIGCERVLDLLKEKESQYGTVLVITHNSELAELFNNKIVVTKGINSTKVIGEV